MRRTHPWLAVTSLPEFNVAVFALLLFSDLRTVMQVGTRRLLMTRVSNQMPDRFVAELARRHTRLL